MGYPRHAAVCERHTGTGLTKEQIEHEGWPLPARDFIPVTLEEQLICFADKFYSKTKHLEQARTLEQVVESMRKISDESAKKWSIGPLFLCEKVKNGKNRAGRYIFNINFIFTPFYFVPSQMIMRQVPGLGLLGAMCSDIDEFERD